LCFKFFIDCNFLLRLSRWKVASQSESNSGGAGRNYFSDPDATIIGKFVRYADAAATTPVDGVGGSPTSTVALNTSTPIIGLSSYRFSKASGNRQGEGWSITTDIPLDAPVLQGEPITVQFRYRTSANFAAGDVKMFVYLVGPNTVQALNGIRNDGVYTNDLGATGGAIGQFTGTTNATATTTAIRVIGHIASGSTANYDIDIDEITIGTSATLTAPIVTEWVPYTPSVVPGTGTITNMVTEGYWKRDGDDIILRGSARFTGSPGTWSGGVFIGLPSPFTIDYTKIPAEPSGIKSLRSGQGIIVGTVVVFSRGLVSQSLSVSPSTRFSLNLTAVKTDDTGVAEDPVINVGAGSLASTGSPAGAFSASSFITWYDVRIPITQFANSTNIISSTQAQFQSQFGSVSKTTSQTLTNSIEAKVSFNTVNSNTFGLWDAANNRFTFNKSGRFIASANVFFESNTTNSRYIQLRQNNVTDLALDSQSGLPTVSAGLDFSRPIQVVAGDYIEIFAWQNSGGNLNVVGGNFQVIEIPDLSVVGISGAPVEVLSATSAQLTPAGHDRWHSMTGNSITLSPGVWRIYGKCGFSSSGGDPGYSGAASVGLFGANGTNTSTFPATIDSLPGVTVFNPHSSADLGSNSFNGGLGGTPLFARLNSQVALISNTQTITVFVVPYNQIIATPSFARITALIFAERIR